MTTLIDKKEFRKRYREFMKNVSETLMRVMTINRENKLSFGYFIEKNAEEFPHKVAIIFEDKQITYGEYNEICNQYAHYFLSLGLKKGDIVDLLVKNRSEVLFIIGGAGKIGIQVSMINSDLKEKSLAHSLRITLGKAIIVGEECLEVFNQIKSEIGLTDQLLLFSSDTGEIPCPEGHVDLSATVKEFPVDNPSTTNGIKTYDDFLYIFTSGTTGLPKAAKFPHQRLVCAGLFMGQVLGDLTKDDRVYVTTPLFHSNTIAVGIGGFFMAGATLVLARKFSTSRFWDDVKKYEVTAFNYVGELCRYLVNAPPKPDDADNKVRTVIGNGLRPEIWMEFKTRFDIERIGEFYAATEAMGGYYNYLNFDKTCGHHNQVHAIVKYNVEEEQPVRNENGFMQKVKVGESGLLLFPMVSGSGFVGYKNKEATERVMLRNVLKEGDLWVNTGDLVFDQGCNHIAFVDRLGDTFRWKGHNMSTTEVERIFSTHEQIIMPSAYGVKIPGTDGRAGMVAFTAKVPIEKFDFKRIAEILIENLPPYGVPIFLRFKTTLSMTSTHKLKKAPLKKEGFDIDTIDEPLYVMLPKDKSYTEMTREIYENIENTKYKF